MDVSDLIGDHADLTELHRYAGALLVHLTAEGTPPPRPPVDVPDYWLSPALHALARIMAGEDALEPLTRAAQLDGERTSLFLCLALAVCGHGDRIHASWLGTAFGDLSPDHPVTAGQRALWLAAARGAYGPAGKIFVLRKLDAVEVPPDQDPWLKALVPAEPGLVVPPSLADFPELAQIPALGVPVTAAARLARLRGRCEEITSVRQAPADARWPETEPVAVLRTLIGQGGPTEPLSSLTGHLLDDVQPGADPHLAALALHVAAPVVKAAAESLAASTLVDPPESITVPILGNAIVLRPDGPDAATLAEAERRVAARVPRRGMAFRGAYPLAGVGVVLMVLGVVVAWPFAVGGGAVCGWAWWLLWRRRQQERADAVTIEAELASLREVTQGAVWALHEYGREAKTLQERAQADLTAVTRLLRRGPRAG
ncbi:hypothetical protein [Acrocarpospora catenulata]|uniref:hypothetical protein n=1 Tax=Acrocarpospora catenulata TaxID=2836182 RepID=UPI002023A21C|nr:hypothetical protein [Acrocarpospora catenulata]